MRDNRSGFPFPGVPLLGVALLCGWWMFSRATQHRHFAHVASITDLSVCPRCGYDMRGSDSERCPECGTHGPEYVARARRLAGYGDRAPDEPEHEDRDQRGS